MQVNTTARHYELQPALRDYAEDKVVHLKKYFDHIVNAHIIFSLEKYRHRVEITLHVNGRDFVSIEESDDMYVSVDRSVDKLDRQLRRHKDKLKSRRSTGLSEATLEVVAEEEAEDDDDIETSHVADGPELVVPNPYEFPELDIDTAVSELTANGRDFKIFSNSQTNRLNVIYKIDDNRVGVLEAAVQL